MDDASFFLEEYDPDESEWSTAQPRVWTFHYFFSVEYLESVLARYGIEYNFQSLPLGAPRQTFLKVLKIEEYTHRIRIHTWEFVEGNESTLPEKYWWVDYGSYGIGDRHVWQYEFPYSIFKSPFCCMYVALGWKNKEIHRDLYRCIKWAIEYNSTEEILFELPLDVSRLGENSGSRDDMEVEDRQIFCTDSDPLDRRWECKYGRGTEWEWQWWLRLQVFDSTGIVIRKPRW